MFPQERQDRLNPILEAFRQLPGQKGVQQDDFNSVCIDVHISLKVTQRSFKNSPDKFELPLGSIKAKIRKVLREAGIEHTFTATPVKSYSYGGKDERGNSIKDSEGYDRDFITVEVYL